MTLRPLAVLALGVVALVAPGCAGDDDSASNSGSPPGTMVPAGSRCQVRLHGKGGTGVPTTVTDGVVVIAPDGNADGWGGRQWRYDSDAGYASARAVVAEAVAPCGEIIVDGFSNGGSFAAALYCRGESFEGRLVRVIVDDPVTDHVVDGCAPDPTVAVTLYATGALEAQAPPGTRCSELDWTCLGDEVLGIDAWAQALGTSRQQSPSTEHRPFQDPPEASAWR